MNLLQKIFDILKNHFQRLISPIKNGCNSRLNNGSSIQTVLEEEHEKKYHDKEASNLGAQQDVEDRKCDLSTASSNIQPLDIESYSCERQSQSEIHTENNLKRITQDRNLYIQAQNENLRLLRLCSDISVKYGVTVTPDDLQGGLVFETPYFKGNDFIVHFYNDGRKPSEVLKAYCEREASTFVKLPNIMKDDITENYMATFVKPNIDNVLFIDHCILLGQPIRRNPTHQFGITGYAVYNIPITTVMSNIKPRVDIYNTPHFAYNDISYTAIKRVLRSLYNLCEEPFQPLKLPEFFIKICLEDFHLKSQEEEQTTLQQYYSTHYSNNIACGIKRKKHEMIKSQYDALYSQLISTETITTKWVSEYQLYKMVHLMYEDAIYQYHAKWLQRQSLDIYIPSMKCGIEYQGIQHYEAIEIFGGEDGLIHRQHLDELKRMRCKEHGIALIEIKYNETTTPTIIRKMILEKCANSKLGK